MVPRFENNILKFWHSLFKTQPVRRKITNLKKNHERYSTFYKMGPDMISIQINFTKRTSQPQTRKFDTQRIILRPFANICINTFFSFKPVSELSNVVVPVICNPIIFYKAFLDSFVTYSIWKITSMFINKIITIFTH